MGYSPWGRKESDTTVRLRLLNILPNRKKSYADTIKQTIIWEEEQNGGGVGGHGVYPSPWIRQEYTFRHRSTCRTPGKRGQEYLTSGKEYRTTQNSVGQRN